jgi:LytS/YehU family sensor histidine kinase
MKQSDNKRKMEELEKENLNQQLQYLRYQINPHFFMNTLNNIHALVDIDPAEAKECILELSKLMRYILYEGSKPTIPLDKETEFLKQYISLMRIRYQDNVKIEVELPGSLPGVEIPPLLFISFVENAFKHGVSYDEDSFIKVKMEVIDDMIHFQCVNSRHAPRHANGKDTRKGIGMENVKKRLDLLYGDDYVMEVKSGEKDYGIYVVIPISYEKSSIHDKSSVHEKSEEK